MSDNSFGTLFRFTTWGESHGPAIGCVVDGVPPGEAFSHCVSKFDEHRCLEHQPDDAIKHALIRDSVYKVPKSDPRYLPLGRYLISSLRRLMAMV